MSNHSTLERYAGAVVDGPWIGRNMVSDHRRFTVQLYHGGSIEYVFDTCHGLWRSGSPADDRGDLKLNHKAASKYRRIRKR